MDVCARIFYGVRLSIHNDYDPDWFLEKWNQLKTEYLYDSEDYIFCYIEESSQYQWEKEQLKPIDVTVKPEWNKIFEEIQKEEPTMKETPKWWILPGCS